MFLITKDNKTNKIKQYHLFNHNKIISFPIIHKICYNLSLNYVSNFINQFIIICIKFINVNIALVLLEKINNMKITSNLYFYY